MNEMMSYFYRKSLYISSIPARLLLRAQTVLTTLLNVERSLFILDLTIAFVISLLCVKVF